MHHNWTRQTPVALVRRQWSLQMWETGTMGPGLQDNLGEKIENAGVWAQGYISPFRLRMGSWRRKPTANNDKGGEILCGNVRTASISPLM